MSVDDRGGRRFAAQPAPPRRRAEIGLLTQIREDFRTHREGFWAQGAWALAFHRIASRRRDCPVKLVRAPWRVFNLFTFKLAEMVGGISLPEFAVIGRRLTIEHFGGIIVHASAVIGDDCVIRQQVTIGAKNRGHNSVAPVLGNRVFVGAGAKILGPITIGDDVVIGANAVVLTDVPANSMAIGVPARIRPLAGPSTDPAA